MSRSRRSHRSSLQTVGRTVRLVVVLLALFASTGAGALTVTPLSEDQLIERSELIVRGRCLRTEATRVRGVLMTAAVIRVDATLKGRAAGEIRVLTPGGVDRDRPVPVRQIFPGVPTFEEGEDVILFLSSYAEEPGFAGSPTPSYFFSHLTQGKVSGPSGSHVLDEQQRQIERQLGGRGR